MSLRFALDVELLGPEEDEACLCSQRSPKWPGVERERLEEPGVRVALHQEADPACFRCFGSGVERVRGDDPLALNLSQVRGERFLLVLGLGQKPYGELSIPEARRAVIRARNRASLAPFAVAPSGGRGEGQRGQDGALTLGAARFVDFGVSEGSLRYCVAQFDELVRAAPERGATRILWG